MSESTTKSSSGFGCLGVFVAVFLSVKTYGWTLWLLLHAPLSWIYVMYWIVFKSRLLD